MSSISIQNLVNSNSLKRSCSDDQPPAKRQRRGESGNSENRMGQRDTSLVDAIYTLSRDAICTLSRHILQSNQSDISYVAKVLAKPSSVDPRIRSLLSSVDLRIGSPRNRIQQENARIKAKQLYHTAVSLHNYALSLHTKKDLRENLRKAQSKLYEALEIEPNNAATRAFLGVVLKNHALFLPREKARLQKLKEAETQLEYALKTEPRNAATRASLGGVLELQTGGRLRETIPIFIEHSETEVFMEAQAEYTQAKRQRRVESGNSKSGMGQRDTSLVDAICTLNCDAICTLSRHILQSNQNDISYVESILAKLSSVDPRIRSFLSSVDPRIGSIRNRIKARQLYHTGVRLHNRALVPGGVKARRTLFMKAQDKLQASLEIEPNNAATLAFLGVVLKNHTLGPASGKAITLQLEQLDAAQAKLQASLEIEPRNAATLASLGGVLELQAKLLFSQANSSSYMDYTAEYKLELLKKSQAKYKAALVISPRRPDIVSSLRDVIGKHAYILRIESYKHSGPSKLEILKEAQAKYEALLAIEPNDLNALYRLGEMLFKQAKLLFGKVQEQTLNEAQAKYEALLALEKDPNSAAALCSLGSVLKLQATFLSGNARLQKLNEAQTKLEAAIVTKKRNIFKGKALFNLGEVLCEQAEFLSGNARLQKLKEAQAKLQASLKNEPKNASALSFLGEMLCEQAKLLSGNARLQKLKEAQTKLEAAIARPRYVYKPSDYHKANTLFHLGGVLKLQSEFLSGKVQLQKLKEAQAKFEAALVIKTNDASALSLSDKADALFRLGAVLKNHALFLPGERARLQKLKEAQAKFEAGLVIKPFDAVALTYLEEIAQSITSSD